MMDLSAAQWVLLAVAAYVAVATLVRLMQSRRDRLLDEMTQQAETERRLQKVQQRSERRRRRLEELRQQEGRSGDAARP